jgi:hypothetical protein
MNRGFALGALVGVGVVMLVPGVAAAISRAGRPLARAALKTGAVAVDEFQKAGAEAFEHLEDILAEVRAEMAAEAAAADAAADAGASGDEAETVPPAGDGEDAAAADAR